MIFIWFFVVFLIQCILLSICGLFVHIQSRVRELFRLLYRFQTNDLCFSTLQMRGSILLKLFTEWFWLKCFLLLLLELFPVIFNVRSLDFWWLHYFRSIIVHLSIFEMFISHIDHDSIQMFTLLFFVCAVHNISLDYVNWYELFVVVFVVSFFSLVDLNCFSSVSSLNDCFVFHTFFKTT